MERNNEMSIKILFDIIVLTTLFVVSASAISPPIITNGIGATLITSNSTRLNGEITNTGGENPAAYILWGLTDGGTNTSSWSQHSYLGIIGLGTFNVNVSSLTPETQYYYRCYAINSGGIGWASSTATFKTVQPASPSA